MKKIQSCVLIALLAGVANTKAGEFDGLYVGLDAGANKSTATALSDKNNSYAGVVAGYNWDFESYLLGVDAFYDAHNSSYTKEDGGVDAKLGLPMNKWLPYAKLGLAATTPGTRLHGGLGVEYKFAEQWSVNGEWMTDKKSSDGIDYKNNNFVVGVNYYFGTGSKVAAVKEMPVREVAKPVPSESVKAAMIEKPVRLEGANFATGSSQLLPGAGEKLDEVVNAANQFPDIRLDVTGYTDNVGDAQSNLKLSQDRADAVKAYLVNKGVAADRISTKGFGENNPIADNATSEGRAKNRRVEVRYSIMEEQKIRTAP